MTRTTRQPIVSLVTIMMVAGAATCPSFGERLAGSTGHQPEKRQLLENENLQVIFSWEDGLRMEHLVHKGAADDALKNTPHTRLFVITTPEEQLDAMDFSGDARFTRRGSRNIWSWEGTCPRAKLTVRLSVSVNKSSESTWQLEVRNAGNEPTRLQIAFPVLDGLTVGDNLDSNCYFHGMNGGMMGDMPIDLKAMYGYSLPVMDVYDGDAGGGFFVRINDTLNRHKVLDLVKRVSAGDTPAKLHDVAGASKSYTDVFRLSGVGMAVHYPECELAPGAGFTSPYTVIAAHTGDWRACMEAYRAWAHTWYRPRAPRPLWFRRVFAHKAVMQEHYHSGETYRLAECIQPGDDMLILNHWMENRGDYQVRGDWGGAAPLRVELRRARDAAMHCTLYLEAVCVDRQSAVGKAHGEDWTVLENGARRTSEATVEWNFCAGAPGWQDYLAETCARLLRETGCDAVYPDSLGIRYYYCEDPHHDHLPGWGWYGSVEQLLRKVRTAMEKVEPNAVLYLEFLSTDVNTQYLDGCFSPCVNAGIELRQRGLNLAPTGTNLFRFYFPDFKFIEIVPETEEAVSLAFFNGNGVHGYLKDPGIRPLVERLSQIFREHSDAFTSDHPTPFVPTLKARVYAHAFPGLGETLYTVYNANDEPLEGEILEVPSDGNGGLEELIGKRVLRVAAKGKKAVLSFRIEPREVLCIAAPIHDR